MCEPVTALTGQCQHHKAYSVVEEYGPHKGKMVKSMNYRASLEGTLPNQLKKKIQNVRGKWPKPKPESVEPPKS